MKVFLMALVFLVLSAPLRAQRPVWHRVYTFDDSVIEMNTASLVLGGDIARVEFRWRFDRPQTLSKDSKDTYNTRAEVFEFDCKKKRYRPFQTTLIDAAGKVVYEEGVTQWIAWRPGDSGIVMTNLMGAACNLVRERSAPEAASLRNGEFEKVADYTLSFWQAVDKTKDFKPIIKQFFVGEYLKGYRRDRETNWFFNLNRDTATRATTSDLERFYIAVLNNSYLSFMYFATQSESVTQNVSEEKLLPADVLELVRNHSYTARYKGNRENFDYLAENIDSIERLRSYTDLLEQMSEIMRRHVANLRSDDFRVLRELSEEVPKPDVRVCVSECLGLPRGTRLFTVAGPFLRLQVAEIKGKLKVVSASEATY